MKDETETSSTAHSIAGRPGLERALIAMWERDPELQFGVPYRRMALEAAALAADVLAKSIDVREGVPHDVIAAAVLFLDGSEAHARVLRHVIAQGDRVEALRKELAEEKARSSRLDGGVGGS